MEAQCPISMDTFWKTSSSTMRAPNRYLVATQYRSLESNRFRAVAVTGLVNRLNEEIPAQALRVDNYLLNPVGLWNHNWGSLPIFKTLALSIEGSALVIGAEWSPLPDAQAVKILYDLGFLNTFSIGFLISETERITRDGKQIRRVVDGELLEISACPVPVEPGALLLRSEEALCYRSLTGALTGEDVERCGALPFHETPKLDDEDFLWNASAEIQQASIDGIKMMCAWYDDEYPDAKDSYKLPHHRHEKPYSVVLRAVIAAGNSLMAAHDGVDIPNRDIASVKAHLAKHYHQFDKTAPWEGQNTMSEQWFILTKRMQLAARELREGHFIEPFTAKETQLAALIEIVDSALSLIATYSKDARVDEQAAIKFLVRGLASANTNLWLEFTQAFAGELEPIVLERVNNAKLEVATEFVKRSLANRAQS